MDYPSLRWREKSSSGFEFRRENVLAVHVFRSSCVHYCSSSYCNNARLNFQAFALRDMNIATLEACRVGEKMSYHFSFC